MPILLHMLQWAFNTTATALFGIGPVLLVAYIATPWLGVSVTAVLAATIPVARRVLHRAPWRSEYGWCLLLPGVGLWLRRRLVRQDPVAAEIAMRLACYGGLMTLLLANIVWSINIREYTATFKRAASSDTLAARYMQGYIKPLETLHTNQLFRELTPEQQGRLDRAWEAEQERWWRDRFQTDPSIVYREQALTAFNYARLPASQKSAFDRAWREMNPSDTVQKRTPRP